MAHYTVKLPDIGEGIAESEIANWRVKPGDSVAEDEPLVDMLTDKAAVELPSPVAGKVVELHGQPGDKIAVGGNLVTLETGPEAAASAGAEAPAAAATRSTESTESTGSTAAPSPERAEATRKLPVPAAPSVRKLARERGIDLHEIHGSGPSGRVLREDLERHAARAAGIADAPQGRAGGEEAVERIPIIGLRRKIAEAMQSAAQRIPHFSYVEEIDVTELEALRKRLNERYPQRTRLTLLPLLIQALVRAVPQYPMVNARYDDQAGVLLRHRALHAGIATQTASGLVVPVLRDAQTMNLWQRAEAIRRLADAARAGKSTREELSGSTITITSLGALGGIVTTPVINAPEVAIIGVNRIMARPVVHDDRIVVRQMMNLSSSFDHRIVDGYDAASFIQRVKALLEEPLNLFIEGA